MDLSSLSGVSKAIAGGLVSAVVALVARYGGKLDPASVSALGVLVTALVGYVVGHIAVYFAPANK